MNFVLAERHRNAQDLAFPLWSNGYRYQNRQMANLPIFANLFVIGIQKQIWIFASVHAISQLLVHLSCSLTHHRRSDRGSAQLLGNRFDLASGCLALHFCQCQRQGSFTSQSSSKAFGINCSRACGTGNMISPTRVRIVFGL